jgi:hypothetical protein
MAVATVEPPNVSMLSDHHSDASKMVKAAQNHYLASAHGILNAWKPNTNVDQVVRIHSSKYQK